MRRNARSRLRSTKRPRGVSLGRLRDVGRCSVGEDCYETALRKLAGGPRWAAPCDFRTLSEGSRDSPTFAVPLPERRGDALRRSSRWRWCSVMRQVKEVGSGVPSPALHNELARWQQRRAAQDLPYCSCKSPGFTPVRGECPRRCAGLPTSSPARRPLPGPLV
jgi:hypothetical protein